MAISATTRFRVIHHAPICPRCGGSNITTDEVEITDGLTEEAFICLVCGEAWPLACVTDWSTPTHAAPATPGIAPDLEGGQ